MANFFGTGGDDNFTGTANSDLFDMSMGGQDTARGRAGDDVFFFGSSLAAGDTVVGGHGVDTLYLSGDYSAGLTFSPTTIAGIEWLTLTGGSNYTLTMDNGNVADNGRFSIDALALHATDTLNFDGSAETRGSFRIGAGNGADDIETGGGADTVAGGSGDDIIETGGGQDKITGGGGLDLLNGGSGQDTFIYTAVSQSTNETYDTIEDFAVGRDTINLDVSVLGMDAQINTGSLSDGPTYVSDFETTVDGSHLAAHHAVVWIPDSGTDAGDVYVVIDANGVAGFQSGQDYIIELEDPTHLDQLDEHTFI